MNQSERVDQIASLATSEVDALTMAMCAVADMANGDGLLLSVRKFGEAAELILAVQKAWHESINWDELIESARLVSIGREVFRKIEEAEKNGRTCQRCVSWQDGEGDKWCQCLGVPQNCANWRPAVIENGFDHTAALAFANQLMGAESGAALTELRRLSVQIELYEDVLFDPEQQVEQM